MIYVRLEIPELVLCQPKINEDNRGFVYESFKQSSFNEFCGFDVNFCQDNILFSKYGVIRGLHTNSLDHAQSKLISVLEGKILDVAVDFRLGSPTYGKYIAVELSSENRKQLFVPRGFLHGFSVLSSQALVMIKIDRYFSSGESIGIKYDDEFLNINWGIPKDTEILSPVDKKLLSLNEVLSPFKYNARLY